MPRCWQKGRRWLVLTVNPAGECLTDAERAAARRGELPGDPITPQEAARLLGCTPRTVRRHVKQGRWRAWRVGGRTILSEAHVRRVAQVMADYEGICRRWRDLHSLVKFDGRRGGANETAGGELLPFRLARP